ncbi:hypothetical protein Godav_025288 [Gossypium davidsonii]|uniref:Uncharacterized protein n=1 Tax=Gossypium davidsonii TaxID=34287 RepID=A0A7J8T7Y0_GOSDV|nr:hypothetical protein [Gossypium davidsonii]
MVWERAATLSQDFRIHNMVFKPMLPVPQSGKCWLKPPHDIIKINFDTVVSPEKIGVGMIVRDSDGFVLGGGGSVIDVLKL